MDPGVAVPPAGLDQEHARVGILAEAVGEGAAGRPRTDDDGRIGLARHGFS